MRIVYEKFTVKDEPAGGFSVSENGTNIDRETGEKKQVLKNYSYHATIGHCLTELFNRKIRKSKAKTLQELLTELKNIRKEIKGLTEC